MIPAPNQHESKMARVVGEREFLRAPRSKQALALFRLAHSPLLNFCAPNHEETGKQALFRIR